MANEYLDADGNSVSLDVLCKREPAWAADRIRVELARISILETERDEARANLSEASKAWDGPDTSDFLEGTRLEAAHQIARWGVSHDAGKTAWDWFWLVGYLVQKAAVAAVEGDTEKAKHHTISTAATLLNWYSQLGGSATQMRPGIDAPTQGENS